MQRQAQFHTEWQMEVWIFSLFFLVFHSCNNVVPNFFLKNKHLFHSNRFNFCFSFACETRADVQKTYSRCVLNPRELMGFWCDSFRLRIQYSRWSWKPTCAGRQQHLRNKDHRGRGRAQGRTAADRGQARRCEKLSHCLFQFTTQRITQRWNTSVAEASVIVHSEE